MFLSIGVIHLLNMKCITCFQKDCIDSDFGTLEVYVFRVKSSVIEIGYAERTKINNSWYCFVLPSARGQNWIFLKQCSYSPNSQYKKQEHRNI